MEKEQIISTLKEKVGQTSISDRSLSTYIENNLPSEGTEPDDAYWTKHVNIIKSFQGQFNADVAASIASQIDTKVEEYYSKNPSKLKEYLKAHPELLKDDSPKPTIEDDRYKKLEEELAMFKKEQKEREHTMLVSQMRSQVLDKVNKDNLNVNQALWEDAVKLAELKDNGTVDDLYASAKSLYETNYKRVFGNSAKPYESSRSAFTPQPNNSSVKSYFEKKRKREGWGNNK